MIQEEYMNVLALKRQGWTITETAHELGYHPATISNWLRNGGPPAQRAVAPSERVIDERWTTRIAALIAPPSRGLGLGRRAVGASGRLRAGADTSTGLAPLPRRRFDTAYVEARRVHVAVPLVTWDDVRYSVPPDCLGQMVTARVEVDATELVLSCGGRVVARHQLGAPGSDDVWDPAHRAAAEAAALGRKRPLRLVSDVSVPAPVATALQLPFGDYDVEAPDLAARYGGEGQA